MPRNKSKIELEIARIIKYEKEEIRGILDIGDGEVKVIDSNRNLIFIRREGDVINIVMVDKKKGTTNTLEFPLGGSNNGRSV